MTIQNTAQAIVEALIDQGVDTIFGIPGVHTYEFSDALYRARDRLRMVHTRHEQGAAYMAYGYAKSTGRPGIFTVVPGPGVLNAGAALCTAFGADAPVMCITGNIMSHLIGRGRGQLHELPDQLALLRGLTKWAARIDHVSEASRTMAEAFSRMMSGRRRPVAVEVPWDVFGMTGPVTKETATPYPHARPDPAHVDAAAALIKSAKNPMIMVGGGACDAGPEVLALARLIGAPVVAHRSGKGVISDDDPHAICQIAGYAWWKTCDLLIGIGSRLELQFMRWRWQPTGLKMIRIDIDPTEMVRLKPDIPIVADAAEGTAALTAALRGIATPDRIAAFEALRSDAKRKAQAVQPQMAYLDAIREALPRDGFFVEEVSQIGFAARFGFPVFGPRHYVTCGYQETLGYGFNTALGVKVAHPDKAVVCVAGDGAFMFGVQELATAVQHGIGVVTVVFNNSSYGNVRRDQLTTYQGRLIGSDLVNPDFVALANSFGAHGMRADSPASLKGAIEDALSLNAPAVIEVPVATDSETSPWPLLMPAPYN